jgi:diacylglycerol kinase family enzyme
MGSRLAQELRSRGQRAALRVVDDLRRARPHLVRDARDFACLVGIGGDHTLSELARVAHEARVPLLPVPAGFGNIFAAALGWRASVPAVIETLERGRLELVDAGLFRDSLFLANQGFGFLEQVKTAVELVEPLPRRCWRRYQRYVRAAVRSFARASLPRLHVDVDGEVVADRAPLAIVANVPTYRGFMPLVTDASPFDGRLDVLVAPPMSKLGLVAWLLGVLLRAPGAPRATVHRRAARITVTEGLREDVVAAVPGAVPVLLPCRAAAPRRPPRAF